MKKLFILVLFILLLTGCKTQEDIQKEKKEEEINKISEELDKEEVPTEAKEWLINIKTEDVLTVFCISTSKKCATLKEDINSIKKEYKLLTYYFEFDKIDENVRKVYKETFKLNDYTGYLPYIIISSKNTLIKTHTDTLSKDDLIKLLKENKIISN